MTLLLGSRASVALDVWRRRLLSGSVFTVGAAILALATVSTACLATTAMQLETSPGRDLVLGQKVELTIRAGGYSGKLRQGLVVEVFAELLNSKKPGMHLVSTCTELPCTVRIAGRAMPGVRAFRARIRNVSDSSILYHTSADTFVQWRQPQLPPAASAGPPLVELTVNGTIARGGFSATGDSTVGQDGRITFMHGTKLSISAKMLSPLLPGWRVFVEHDGDNDSVQARYAQLGRTHYVVCELTPGSPTCDPVPRPSKVSVGNSSHVFAYMIADNGYTATAGIILRKLQK